MSVQERINIFTESYKDERIYNLEECLQGIHKLAVEGYLDVDDPMAMSDVLRTIAEHARSQVKITDS